jgi:hypothetical protein
MAKKLMDNRSEQVKLIEIVRKADIKSDSGKQKVIRAVEAYSDHDPVLGAPSLFPEGYRIGQVYMVCKGHEMMVQAGYRRSVKESKEKYQEAIEYALSHQAKL